MITSPHDAAISRAPPAPGSRTCGEAYEPITVVLMFAKRSSCATPTRHVAPFGSARAAAIVIISAAVYVAAWVRGSSREDMILHPLPEGVAVAADRVPRDVEVVVAHGVAVGVRRVRAVRGHRHVVDRPPGQDDRTGPRLERLDDLLDGDEHPPRAEGGLLLHADD